MKARFEVLGADGNFLGIDEKSRWDEARVVVLPVPLELSTTYMKGTASGPAALLEASHQVELFDDELKSETYLEGIVTLPPMAFRSRDPQEALEAVEGRVSDVLREGKRLVVLGGEHTVTVGVVRAYRRAHPGLTVLHLDAHADLRDEYEGSGYNHACVMARVGEVCPFVSVGVRSLGGDEFERIRKDGLRVYDVHRMRGDGGWIESSLRELGNEVYITLDLDVLDPSVVGAVGTPEPGGMAWNALLFYLREVFSKKRVLGFDVVELSPRPGTEYGVFAAAKLVYRMIGYWIGLKTGTGNNK